MHLVLIETSGNQDYIFATNKLRENVGASELVWRIGQFVRDEVKRQVELVPAVAAEVVAEVVMAVSGKAIVLVRDEPIGRAIIRAVTERVLRDAPGVDVHGALSVAFEFGDERIHEIVREVHDKHLDLKGTIPGPQERFLRLPVIAECATSGLPAALLEAPRRNGEKRELRSAVSQAKRNVAEDALRRMSDAAAGIPLARTVDDLDRLEEVDWLAVVHADGNGLGQMFLDFGELVYRHTGSKDSRCYVDALDRFSTSLNECTKQAFRAALTKVWPFWERRYQRQHKKPPGWLPLVPLVLGGDDVTIVCDGRLAVPFAVEFLQEFERQSRNGIVGDLSEKRKDMPVRGLAACAGVAIVKPHFPFYAAYSLAEHLLKSAKMVKSKVSDRPTSAFDFHILYDASGPDLDRIRDELTLDEGSTHLTARPYVVSAPDGLPSWAAQRHVDLLRRCLKAVQAKEDGRRRLPNSMLHDLREGLFLGHGAAEARLKLALGRHLAEQFGPLLDSDRLFWQEQEETEGGELVTCRYTRLLDTMDLAEFWEQENIDA